MCLILTRSSWHSHSFSTGSTLPKNPALLYTKSTIEDLPFFSKVYLSLYSRCLISEITSPFDNSLMIKSNKIFKNGFSFSISTSNSMCGIITPVLFLSTSIGIELSSIFVISSNNSSELVWTDSF